MVGGAAALEVEAAKDEGAAALEEIKPNSDVSTERILEIEIEIDDFSTISKA